MLSTLGEGDYNIVVMSDQMLQAIDRKSKHMAIVEQGESDDPAANIDFLLPTSCTTLLFWAYPLDPSDECFKLQAVVMNYAFRCKIT